MEALGGDGRGGSFEARVQVLRRNLYVPLAGLALALGGGVGAMTGHGRGPLGSLAILMGSVLALVTLRRNAFPLAREVALRVENGRMKVGEAAPFATSDVTSIRRVRTTAKTPPNVLELAVRGRADVRLGAFDDDVARLLDLLGDRSSRHRLVVPFWKRFVSVLGVLALVQWLMAINAHGAHVADPDLLGMAIVGLFGLAFPLAFVLALLVGFVHGRAVVGVDGIATKWLAWKRFVPFADVVDVTPGVRIGDAASVVTVIRRTNGKPLRLLTPEEPTTNDDRGLESHALFDATKIAFTRARERVRLSDPKVVLARGHRSAEEWLASLDRLTGARGGYRDAVVDPAALAEVAADPTAAVELRVAAATAVTRAGDATLVTRIRVAAEATADPTTRTFLTRLSTTPTDEEALSVLTELSSSAR